MSEIDETKQGATNLIHIDLHDGTILKTIPLSGVATNVAVSVGWGYGFGSGLLVANLQTGMQSPTPDILVQSGIVGRISNQKEQLYVINPTEFPPHIQSFPLIDGIPSMGMDTAPSDMSICGDLWVNEAGTHAVTACGEVVDLDDRLQVFAHLHPSASWKGDIVHLDSDADKMVALVEDLRSSPRRFADKVAEFDAKTFELRKTTPLPQVSTVGGAYQAFGRWVFLESNGSNILVVARDARPADGESVAHGFALLTLPR